MAIKIFSKQEIKAMENVISEFYGMTILMSFDPKDSTPHFDVLYEGEICRFNIDTMQIYKGTLDDIGMEIIRGWIHKNRWLIRRNWDLVTTEQSPKKIPPFVE